MRHFFRTRNLLGLACSLTLLCGCSEQRTLTVPVEGQITFGGDVCPGPGSVVFGPISETQGYPRRPARGSFGVDGKFGVTSFQPNDGLVPGTYQVRVDCWQKPPSELGPGVSFVPKDFSPPNVKIDPDSREPFKLVIDVPRDSALRRTASPK